jgi:hypothetical protein
MAVGVAAAVSVCLALALWRRLVRREAASKGGGSAKNQTAAPYPQREPWPPPPLRPPSCPFVIAMAPSRCPRKRSARSHSNSAGPGRANSTGHHDSSLKLRRLSDRPGRTTTHEDDHDSEHDQPWCCYHDGKPQHAGPATWHNATVPYHTPIAYQQCCHSMFSPTQRKEICRREAPWECAVHSLRRISSWANAGSRCCRLASRPCELAALCLWAVLRGWLHEQGLYRCFRRWFRPSSRFHRVSALEQAVQSVSWSHVRANVANRHVVGAAFYHTFPVLISDWLKRRICQKRSVVASNSANSTDLGFPSHTVSAAAREGSVTLR